MISPEAVLGLPGYQITGIEEINGEIRIEARYSGVIECPDCHSQRLRLKESVLVSRGTRVGVCGAADWY